MARARPRYISQQLAADDLGVTVQTIRRRIQDGTLPAYRVSGRVRIKVSDLGRLIEPIPASVQ